jgi:hypothetical protein
MILNRIADDKLRSDVLDRVADMDHLMFEYQKTSFERPEVEPAPHSMPPPAQ